VAAGRVKPVIVVVVARRRKAVENFMVVDDVDVVKWVVDVL